MNGTRQNHQSFRRGDENRPPTPDFSEYPVEWYPPFVGAMKIARNLAVSGRYIEWYSPHPGSLSEGAVTPKGRD